MGVLYGIYLSGLAVHSSIFSLKDLDMLGVICGVGVGIAVLGRLTGGTIGWLPVTLYCVPLIFLGGAFSAFLAKWDSIIAVVVCVVICVISYIVVDRCCKRSRNRKLNQNETLDIH